MGKESCHPRNLPAADLLQFLDIYKDRISFLRGSRILVTGGTGFLGQWLVSCLMQANRELQLGIELELISRAPKTPETLDQSFQNKSIKWIFEDIRNISWELSGGYDYVIHAATPAQKVTGNADVNLVATTVVEGTKNLISNLKKIKFSGKLIHTSSGAVYGNPELRDKSIEEFEKTDRLTSNPYGVAKIRAEEFLREFGAENSIQVCNARLFAFGSPLIPLDENFAIGNFILNALNSETIQVTGNPTTQRSYLHAVDMVGWLICALNCELEYVHIGSNSSVDMYNLASSVSRIVNNSKNEINIPNTYRAKSVYVPQNIFTMQALNVSENISLDQIIERWVKWLKKQ